MIDGIINLIGKNARFLAIGLICLIVANAGFQFYTHKTTALTAWKGGGFGMYTEPHADGRTVWLEMRGNDGTVEMRVHPENEELRIWIDGVSLRGGAALQIISKQAEGLRYYPDKEKADALIKSVARIGWLDSITGGVAPKVGKTFKPEDIRVLVYDTVQNMQEKTLTRSKVFDTSDGGL